MNKSAIVKKVDTETLEKLLKLSKSMQKRIKMQFESNIIIVKRFNNSLLSVFDWIQIGQEDIQIKNNPIQKRVLNYKVMKQVHIQAIQAENQEIRCSLALLEPIKEATIEYVHKVWICSEDYHLYSNLRFKQINRLRLEKLSTDQVNNILDRVESVRNLTIQRSNLGKISFKTDKFAKIMFIDVCFSKNLALPALTDNLTVIDCSKINLLFYSKISTLYLRKVDELDEKELFWLKGMTELKQITTNRPIEEYFEALSPLIRKITNYGLSEIDLDFKQIKAKLPYLFSINSKIKSSLLENLRLREVFLKVKTNYNGVFKARPRRISVTADNSEILNNHPELFEKALQVRLRSKKLKFDVLPDELNNVLITEFDVDGKELSRF